MRFVRSGGGTADPCRSCKRVKRKAPAPRVVFKRDLRSTGNISFEEDQLVPIAFSVWDGFNRERGNKRALSAWMYVYTMPAQEVSKVAPVARAAIGVLIVELVLILWIRRRFAHGVPGLGGGSVDGALPEGGMVGVSR